MSALTAFPSVTGGASSSAASAAASSTTTVASQNAEAGERFLKLLITQLQNQDPMNPMDNAQLTTQMAQINTVAGIEKLNDSVNAMSGKLASLDPGPGLGKVQEALQGLSGKMLQSQAVQGAALIGRKVWLEGNALPVHDGVANAMFDLSGAADSVTVEVLSPSGFVVASKELGPKGGGRVPFDWTVTDGVNPDELRYRVSAKSGSTDVKVVTFTPDRVNAVSAGANGLVLQLARTGATAIERIKSFS